MSDDRNDWERATDVTLAVMAFVVTVLFIALFVWVTR